MSRPATEAGDGLGDRPGKGDVRPLGRRRLHAAQEPLPGEQLGDQLRLGEQVDAAALEVLGHRRQERSVTAVGEPSEDLAGARVEPQGLGARVEGGLGNLAGHDRVSYAGGAQRRHRGPDLAGVEPGDRRRRRLDPRIGVLVKRDGDDAPPPLPGRVRDVEGKAPHPRNQPQRLRARGAHR
jgi:hypothetical protein